MESFGRLVTLGMTVVAIGSMFIGFSLSGMAGVNFSGAQAPVQGHEFHLTLVITTNNWFNNTIGFEPAYYVLQGNQLVSSANISLPGDTPILVTIINYDNGAAATPAEFANVSGTEGNIMFVMNDTDVNSTLSSSGPGISVNGGQQVSAVPDNNIAHTFTIQKNGMTVLNIPVEPSSIETATFTLSAGAYSWRCMAACGSGPNGWGGAMVTPGWMAGIISVS